ncbi:MAG TPA: alpha/beta fold hydrolase [Pseudonocardiaceae bacterium]|jgi:dienelactone hydrolase|nr:alpha/beta fold hydrolase [Pseudonocardiaceae bacterium]
MRAALRSTFVKVAVIVLAVGGLLVGSVQVAGAATAPSTGFNDWSCRPSATHPDPVVALHGLGGNGPGNYAFLGPSLASAGYCVFAPTYGQPVSSIPVGGLVSIADSASQVTAFIDQVLSTTGAAKVDIVGHSEGGFLSLYVPKVSGYAGKVDRVVALAPPTHGTNFANLVTLADLLGVHPVVDQLLNTFGCQACSELITGGSAVATLTNGPIAQPGVSYTIIASQADELVTPHQTSFVAEPGVHNAFVQDTCPLDPVGHIGLAFDGGVADMVRNALDPANAKPVNCGLGLPF